LLHRFHRRHPRAPHPHTFDIDRPILPLPTSTTDNSVLPSQVHSNLPSDTTPSESLPPIDARVDDSTIIRPPDLSLHTRPITPPLISADPRSNYAPPPFTTLRSGRISRPPPRFDP
jgi:hypothetical protein